MTALYVARSCSSHRGMMPGMDLRSSDRQATWLSAVAVTIQLGEARARCGHQVSAHLCIVLGLEIYDGHHSWEHCNAVTVGSPV